MTITYKAAMTAFLATDPDWAALPFFRDGSASHLADVLDSKAAAGASILPSPAVVLNALSTTALANTRVVILGQDPYPTPGDAHGLAFSVSPGVAIPRSLRNIFKEMQADLGCAMPTHGHLQGWARQGVLLLNTCLTVEAGLAGSHRQWGWEALSDQMIRALSDRNKAVAFLLWGADAHKKAVLIDAHRHLMIKTAHPSPLSARRGFFGSRPFSRTNAWLNERGLETIDWSATGPTAISD